MYQKSSVNKTKEIFDKVVKNIQTIVANGDYEKFLKLAKNFRRYSFNNRVLIFSQFPEATKVAGKSSWLKMKRETINGAKKIFIIAPIPRKYNKKVTKIEFVTKKRIISFFTYKICR